jgi:hypothetical protein
METEIKEKTEGNVIVKKNKKAPIGMIIMSGLSFIPAIGVLFGFVSIVISLFNFKRFKLLFILGLSGIIFSIVLYSTLYYYGSVKRGGTYDKLRVSMDIYLLKEIDKEIVNYKFKFGTYPTELKDILKENKNLTLKDPIVYVIKNYKGDSLFYYKMIPDSFVLFSVGFDGKPFTNDDIHPSDIDSLMIKK